MSDLNTARRSIGEPSTSFETSELCGVFLPRSSSEPVVDLQRTVFVRFRSFREPKRKATAPTERRSSPSKPVPSFRVSTFSIPSSDDRRVAKRRCVRKRAKRRMEKQLSASSSDCSPSPYNRLLMDNDIARFPSPPPTSETTLYPETDYREAKRSSSHLGHSSFLNGNHTPSLLAASSTGSFGDQIYDHDEEVIQEEIQKLREVARRINEKSQIERLRLQSTDSEGIDHLPPTWADNINYTEDMEQFIQNTVPMNPFSDPFEDHHSDRRSRTEMWVESTSPGVMESESEAESVEEEEEDPTMIERQEIPMVPQVTVDGCSESEGAPSTSSIPLPSFPISIKVNGETLKGDKSLRGHIERDDSLQTDISDTSFVSSEMDKTSLAQIKFRTNLDKATEKQWEEIDVTQVDRFWKYLYEPETTEKQEKPKVKEKILRCHTPTVDRVVLYYTSDRRPSMTPSLPPPSPSIYSMSSPALSGRLHLSADSASNLFYRFPPASPNTDKSARSTRSTIPERSESLESKENELAMESEDSQEDQDKPFGEVVKDIAHTAKIMIPSWKRSVYTVDQKGRAVVSPVIQNQTHSVEQNREVEEISIEVPTILPRSTFTDLKFEEAPARQYVEVPERWITTASSNGAVQKQYKEVPDAWRASSENLEQNDKQCDPIATEADLLKTMDQQTKIVIFFSQDSELKEFKQHELIINQAEQHLENGESSNFDGKIYVVDEEQEFGSFEGDFLNIGDVDIDIDNHRVGLTKEERDKILREDIALEDSDDGEDGLSLPVNDLIAKLFHLEECSSSSESEEENEPKTENWKTEAQPISPPRKTPTATVSPFLQRRLVSRSTSTSDLLEVEEPSTSGEGSVIEEILEHDEPIEIRCENGLINTATNSSSSVGSQDNFSPQSEHHSLLRDYRSPIPSFYSKSSQNPPGSSVLSNGRSSSTDANDGFMKLNPESPAHPSREIQHTSPDRTQLPVTPKPTGKFSNPNSKVRRSLGSVRSRRRVIRLPSTTRSKSLSSLKQPKRVQQLERGVLYMAVSDCQNPTLVVIDDDDVAAADTEVSLGGLLAYKTIEDLEMSSTEDLLNLDANRPCSSGRKSVTFSDFINVEIISPQNIRRLSAESHNYLDVKPILKKDDKTRETMRKMIDYARDRLYKDLRMLVEERDRSIHAIQLTSNSSSNLTAQTGFYQTRYREKLQENKSTLDSKIEQVWQKLKELPLEESQALFVYSVHNSDALTLNSRRRVLPRRYTSYYVLERKPNKYDNLELASDYAVKLQQLRGNLIRRESEIRREDEKSVEDIVNRVSRALKSYDKIF